MRSLSFFIRHFVCYCLGLSPEKLWESCSRWYFLMFNTSCRSPASHSGGLCNYNSSGAIEIIFGRSAATCHHWAARLHSNALPLQPREHWSAVCCLLMSNFHWRWACWLISTQRSLYYTHSCHFISTQMPNSTAGEKEDGEGKGWCSSNNCVIVWREYFLLHITVPYSLGYVKKVHQDNILFAI